MTRIWLIALVAAAIAAWNVNGWRWGEKYALLQRDYESAQNTARDNAAELELLRNSRNTDATNRTVAAVDADAATTRTITREVIRYVQAPPDPDHCLLSGDWVRLHEAATGGDLPALASATGAAAGRSETVTAAAALPVIIDNYNDCRADKLRLQHWQDWYKTVAAP